MGGREKSLFKIETLGEMLILKPWEERGNERKFIYFIILLLK